MNQEQSSLYQQLIREYSKQENFIEERLKQRKKVFNKIFEELKPVDGENTETYEKRKQRVIQEINTFINLIKFEMQMIYQIQKNFKNINNSFNELKNSFISKVHKRGGGMSFRKSNYGTFEFVWKENHWKRRIGTKH